MTVGKPPEVYVGPLLLVCSCYCHLGPVTHCVGHYPILPSPDIRWSTLSHEDKEEGNGAQYWPWLRSTVSHTQGRGQLYILVAPGLCPRTIEENQEYASQTLSKTI